MVPGQVRIPGQAGVPDQEGVPDQLGAGVQDVGFQNTGVIYASMRLERSFSNSDNVFGFAPIKRGSGAPLMQNSDRDHT